MMKGNYVSTYPRSSSWSSTWINVVSYILSLIKMWTYDSVCSSQNKPDRALCACHVSTPRDLMNVLSPDLGLLFPQDNQVNESIIAGKRALLSRDNKIINLCCWDNGVREKKKRKVIASVALPGSCRPGITFLICYQSKFEPSRSDSLKLEARSSCKCFENKEILWLGRTEQRWAVPPTAKHRRPTRRFHRSAARQSSPFRSGSIGSHHFASLIQMVRHNKTLLRQSEG